MTMTAMADGLEAQDSSKSAFMEFGQQSHSQQSSPSMAASHYPLHCLHSGSHSHHQHDSSPYSGTNSYNRSLPYPYVSHSHHSPYLPSFHSTASQTRLDDTGSTALSPRSPTIPPIWDVSATTKGVSMPPSSYIPGYSHWYSSQHQDTMQRQMM
ncbi:DLX6A protein, partial [Polyodon spathula]|nr:DLX6A protein [Polyodon spathula]